jgi:hypothetical protein
MFSMGTAAGTSLPSASAPVDRKTSVSVNMRLRLLSKVLRLQQEYSPSTMLATGSVASVTGASSST